MTTLNLYVGARLTVERTIQTATNLCWAGWYLTGKAVHEIRDGFTWVAHVPARRRAANRRLEWECATGRRDWPVRADAWDRRMLRATGRGVRAVVIVTVKLGCAFTVGGSAGLLAVAAIQSPLVLALTVAGGLALFPAVTLLPLIADDLAKRIQVRLEAPGVRLYEQRYRPFLADARFQLNFAARDDPATEEHRRLMAAIPPIHGAGATTGLLGIPETPEHTWEVTPTATNQPNPAAVTTWSTT